MDLVTLSLLVVLEVALLLGIVLAVLWRNNKVMRQQLRMQEQPSASAADSFASIESGYLPYLEKEILATRERLELSATESGVDAGLPVALQQRLTALEAEKKVAESCNDYPERRWEFVSECFRPRVNEPSEAAAESSEVERINELHSVLNQQGDTLLTMRQVLDQAKLDPQAEFIEALEKQLHQLEQRYREAGTCIDIMQQENDRLLAKVDRKDVRIEQIEEEKSENVAGLEEQLGRQRRNISELHHMIDGLQIEAEKAEQLRAKLDQFELASRDMNMCIQVLEEENEFLQEQIKALLHSDDSSSVYDKANKENNREALHQQIADL